MTINGSDITMFCGDTEAFHVSCKMDGVIRQFVAGDKVYFTVKEYETKTDKVISKLITTFTEGKALVDLKSTDTSSIIPGNYVYYVTVVFVDGTRKTVIGPAKFTLLAGVTDG